ncbi:CPBP family glutamic-type intramembrane protease [Limnoglobus roseus]|uniref:CPBP family intramembrane metalloprotease n=1 Tax=Limnoglobus roseus TaxID=2598579 RepID=A0A5C1ABU1_9BACT|nr:CPBP family glutamic-type intramembrane protease [Limnoglobus roseus]QEL16180.1 CPBP family intramembrane metalloprotease [Limnoglobus roseus]
MDDTKGPSYLASTRHPWACFLFLLPLFAVYEFGILWVGGPNPDSIRNGADLWLRWFLENYGFGQLWVAPLLVLGLFFIRSVVRRKDRPRQSASVAFGMLIESILFAFVLWGISRNFRLILETTGLPLNQIQFKTVAAAQFITFVGAGIYEEVLFRLGLFSLCVFLLRAVLFPGVVAVPVAAVGAAVLFAAAHHVYGQPISTPVFLFRAMAGLFFTILYVFRGFGIAVGAHAGYDILVGVAVNPA